MHSTFHRDYLNLLYAKRLNYILFILYLSPSKTSNLVKVKKRHIFTLFFINLIHCERVKQATWSSAVARRVSTRTEAWVKIRVEKERRYQRAREQIARGHRWIAFMRGSPSYLGVMRVRARYSRRCVIATSDVACVLFVSAFPASCEWAPLQPISAYKQSMLAIRKMRLRA